MRPGAPASGAMLAIAFTLLASPALAAEPPPVAKGDASVSRTVELGAGRGILRPDVRLASLALGPFDPEDLMSRSGAGREAGDSGEWHAEPAGLDERGGPERPASGAPARLGLEARLSTTPVDLRGSRRDRHVLAALAPRDHDLGLFLVAQSSLLIDMAQTMEIRRTEGLYETNPLLGEAPGDAEALAYFGSAAALHALSYAVLPGRWANLVSRAVLFLEVPAIDNNVRLGVAINF